MTEPEIYAQLTELFREIFSDDDIMLKPETTAADIDGWDSFNHISIIVSVETKFGIKMETREIEGLNNIGTLVATISKKLAR